MRRREILKYTTFITGAAIAMPLMGTFLAGCQQEAGKDIASPSFFSSETASFIKDIVDVILPKTDSPSASEVGVHTMIEHMVGNVYNETEQKKYQEDLETLRLFLKQTDGTLLVTLQQLEQAQDETAGQAKAAYLHIKQQTIVYYLSTKVIATKYLNYLPVPGTYEPCIKLAEVNGKAWAI